jgi:two-component sensor histidine kinase
VGVLLSKYQEYEQQLNEAHEERVLPAAALVNAVENKRYQYKDTPVTFNYTFDPELQFSCVRGDYLSFNRMVSNLLDNAVEATKGKEDAWVSVSFSVEGQYVKISVQDNGVGMPPDVVGKIKSRSQFINSTKHEERGIGLEQIVMTVDSYGGKIDAKSTRNVGTTLTVSFPLVDRPHWIADRLALKKGDTVIVLDDDQSMFHIYEEMLRGHENDVTMKFFTKGNDVLDFIEAHDDGSDNLFFLCDDDLGKSDFNGLTVVMQSKIRKRSVIVADVLNEKIAHDFAIPSDIKVLPKQFLGTIRVIVE